MQCVKLGSSDAKEVTPDMFDATKQRDIRCQGWGRCKLLGAMGGHHQTYRALSVAVPK